MFAMSYMPHSAVLADVRMELVFVNLVFIHILQAIFKCLKLHLRFHCPTFPSPMLMQGFTLSDAVGLAYSSHLFMNLSQAHFVAATDAVLGAHPSISCFVQ